MTGAERLRERLACTVEAGRVLVVDHEGTAYVYTTASCLAEVAIERARLRSVSYELVPIEDLLRDLDRAIDEAAKERASHQRLRDTLIKWRPVAIVGVVLQALFTARLLGWI